MRHRSIRRAGTVVALLLCIAPLEANARWSRYEKCRLVEDAFHDGDSFHVQYGHRTIIIRLYFVDTPETDLTFTDRVDAQAAYWGLTRDRALQLGRRATRFTQTLLRRPFTVHTQRVDARGRSKSERFFGLIETESGLLSEALVRNGLARVYGMSTDLPDGTKASRQWKHLRQLEKRAKRDKLGGWAD